MAKARKDNRGRALRKGETYRKSDGYYTYKYTDPFGNKKYIYSKDLAELRKREENLAKDQLDGLDVYTKGFATLNYVYDRYIRLKTEVRETTRTNYDYTYDHYVRGTLGKRRIADIKYSDIVYFYKQLIEEAGLSVNTVDSVHTVINPVFDLALRDDIIRKNPAQGVMAEMKRKYAGTIAKRHPLSVEQENVFLDELDISVNSRWRPVFTVLLGTGCRVGELIGLRWQDVDFDKKEIVIDHSIVYEKGRKGKGKGRLRVHKPKTQAGIRMIPMLKEVAEALREEKELQDMLGVSCTAVVDGMSGFIFCNRFGGVHHPSGLNRAIHRISDDYNAREEVDAKKKNREPVILPRFSCHNLRHTFCSRLCERETNIKVIQAIMGHADITTTMNIYAEVMGEARHDSFDRMDENNDVFRRSPKR